MIVSALLAAFHYLALGIGLGGVFARGRALRKLRAQPTDGAALHSLFFADNCWGIAALAWIVTGSLRAFAGYEKPAEWYLHHPLFHLKLGLFVLIFALELWPMITFVRWRVRKVKGGLTVPAESLPAFVRINDAEVLLTLLIPFVAVFMARGFAYNG